MPRPATGSHRPPTIDATDHSIPSEKSETEDEIFRNFKQMMEVHGESPNEHRLAEARCLTV